MLRVLPAITRFQVRIIAICGDPKSTLAQNAHVCLDVNVEQEACPNNLAPTTSTTAQLAMGDAIAVCLMELKGFSSDDFAKFHPGGMLGKKLYLRISDIYIDNERPAVFLNQSLKEVIVEMTRKRLGATAVVDDNEILQGIITDGDLRRSLQRLSNTDNGLANIKCDHLMTRDPIVTNPEMLAFDALRLMEDRESQINVLPVVDGEGQCVGLIRLHDIVRSGL